MGVTFRRGAKILSMATTAIIAIGFGIILVMSLVHTHTRKLCCKYYSPDS